MRIDICTEINKGRAGGSLSTKALLEDRRWTRGVRSKKEDEGRPSFSFEIESGETPRVKLTDGQETNDAH